MDAERTSPGRSPSSSEKIYDPRFVPAADTVEAFTDFVAVVRQLRRDCPWDREQTHASVKHLLIEEAYEALDALDAEDWNEVRNELGDVLLHVAFHGAIAEQDGRFTLRDILEAVTEKLIRRHPHVFGDLKVDHVDDVLANWEQIKLKEGRKRSVLEGVPRTLPALLYAYRIQQKAAGVGFDFPGPEACWEKVQEELDEFRALAEAGASEAEQEEELGDLLFAVVNYARSRGLRPEDALRRTNDKFTRRFAYIEARLARQQKAWTDVDLEEMDRYWDEAKARERNPAP